MKKENKRFFVLTQQQHHEKKITDCLEGINQKNINLKCERYKLSRLLATFNYKF